MLTENMLQIYQVVLSVLISPNDAIKFYFTRGPDEKFSAIVSLTIEHCLDQDGRIRVCQDLFEH